MEQIGTLLTNDEAARALVVAAVVWVVVALFKLVRKGETESEVAKFQTATGALVAAALLTVLSAVQANGWTFAGLSLGAVAIRVLVAWWGAMGANSAIKRAAGFAASTTGATLLLVGALLVASVLCSSVAADPGDIEARAYTALAPTFAETWGAGIAVEAWTFPETWPVFGGKLLFGDAVYLRDATALGGSVSVRPADQDNGLRGFAVGWIDGDRKGHWCVGLSQNVANW